MKGKLMISIVLLILIGGIVALSGFKRTLRITFDGEVLKGSEVYVLNSNAIEVLEIGEDGFVEPEAGFGADYIHVKIVHDGEVKKNGMIGPLKYGQNYFDFRGNETYHERTLFFYRETSTSKSMSAEEFQRFLEKHSLPEDLKEGGNFGSAN